MATVIHVKQPRSAGQALGEGLVQGVNLGMQFAFQKQLQRDKQQTDPLARAKFDEQLAQQETERRAKQFEEAWLTQQTKQEGGPANVTPQQRAQFARDADIYVRGGAEVQESIGEKYGILPQDADDSLTPDAATKQLEQTLLRSNPKDLRAGYVTVVDGQAQLTPKGKDWARSHGTFIAGKREQPDDALEEVLLDPNERSTRFASAATQVRDILAQAPSELAEIPPELQEDFSRAVSELQHFTDPSARTAAATLGSDDPVARIISGRQVLLPAVEKQRLEALKAYRDGNDAEGDRLVNELFESGHRDVASAIATSPEARGARGEARAAAGEQRAEATDARQAAESAREQERFEQWREGVRQGERAVYVDARTGEPISTTPLTFQEAVAQAETADAGIPITREAWEGRRDMSLYVPDDWDPLDKNAVDQIEYAPKGESPEALAERGMVPLAIASIRARMQFAKALAGERAARPTEAERSFNRRAQEFSNTYLGGTPVARLTSRQRSYVNAFAPTTVRDPKFSDKEGDSLAAYATERLPDTKLRSLVIAFGAESEALTNLRSRYISVGEEAFKLLTQHQPDKLPPLNTFLSTLDKELNTVIQPFFESGINTAAGVAGWEAQLDRSGGSVEDLAEKVYTRIVGEPPPQPQRAPVEVLSSDATPTPVPEDGGEARPGSEGIDALTESEIYTGPYAEVMPQIKTQVDSYISRHGRNPTKAEIVNGLMRSGATAEQADKIFLEYLKNTRDTRIELR